MHLSLSEWKMRSFGCACLSIQQGYLHVTIYRKKIQKEKKKKERAYLQLAKIGRRGAERQPDPAF